MVVARDFLVICPLRSLPDCDEHYSPADVQAAVLFSVSFAQIRKKLEVEII